MKKVLWIALAAMFLSACQQDNGVNGAFWEEAPLRMEQHQFRIETEILAGLYWHWNNAYATFVLIQLPCSSSPLPCRSFWRPAKFHIK